MAVEKKSSGNNKLSLKISFSYQIEQKTFIAASSTNNIHTGEKAFYSCCI